MEHLFNSQRYGDIRLCRNETGCGFEGDGEMGGADVRHVFAISSERCSQFKTFKQSIKNSLAL